MCAGLTLLVLISASGCEQVEARGLIKEGNRLYRAGKLEAALKKFEEARSLDSDFPLVHLHIGYAAMGLSRPGKKDDPRAKEAAAAFRRYMRLRPTDPRGAMFYLKVLGDTGRYADALAFLRKRLAANPRDVKTVSNLGLFSSKAGRFDDALKWYARRAELQPKDAVAHYLIGALCFTHLRKNKGKIVGTERSRIADQGIAALKRAASLRPGDVKTLVYINLLYRQRALAHDDPVAKRADVELAKTYGRRADALRKKAKPKGSPSAAPEAR